jgi:hypothetical protein
MKEKREGEREKVKKRNERKEGEIRKEGYENVKEGMKESVKEKKG